MHTVVGIMSVTPASDFVLRRWLVCTMAAVAALLAPGQRARGAEGGIQSSRQAPPDARAREASSEAEGPAGTFLGPLPQPAGAQKASESDLERRYLLTPRANGDLLYDNPQFSAVVAPDGTVAFHDRRLEYSARKSTFSFDLSNEFSRAFAHGTSHPYEKADFLAATFKRRTGMAAKMYSRQMRAAETELPRQLDALWADSRYRRRERRRIIFLLWQDVDTAETDRRAAAMIIEAWIRGHLVRGSPDAYSEEELKAYSRERAGEPAFRPYGSPLEMRSPQELPLAPPHRDEDR